MSASTPSLVLDRILPYAALRDGFHRPNSPRRSPWSPPDSGSANLAVLREQGGRPRGLQRQSDLRRTPEFAGRVLGGAATGRVVCLIWVAPLLGSVVEEGVWPTTAATISTVKIAALTHATQRCNWASLGRRLLFNRAAAHSRRELSWWAGGLHRRPQDVTTGVLSLEIESSVAARSPRSRSERVGDTSVLGVAPGPRSIATAGRGGLPRVATSGADASVSGITAPFLTGPSAGRAAAADGIGVPSSSGLTALATAVDGLASAGASACDAEAGTAAGRSRRSSSPPMRNITSRVRTVKAPPSDRRRCPADHGREHDDRQTSR
jgi:hypothetical protein